MENIVKLKAIYLADMTLETKNISDYIKKYFGNNYIIEQDENLGWYNFKIGNKKYEDRLLKEINNKYKVYLKEGYWYLDEEDIKSIVTHEQFSQMEYKVGE